MKLSEQVRSLKQELYDNEATASNVRDQLGILCEQVERLAEASESLTLYIQKTVGSIDMSQMDELRQKFNSECE